MHLLDSERLFILSPKESCGGSCWGAAEAAIATSHDAFYKWSESCVRISGRKSNMFLTDVWLYRGSSHATISVCDLHDKNSKHSRGGGHCQICGLLNCCLLLQPRKWSREWFTDGFCKVCYWLRLPDYFHDGAVNSVMRYVKKISFYPAKYKMICFII